MSEFADEGPDPYTVARYVRERAELLFPDAGVDELDQVAAWLLRGALDVIEGRDPFEKPERGKSTGAPEIDWERLVGPFPDGPARDRLIRDVRLKRIELAPDFDMLAPLVHSCRKVLDPLLDANSDLTVKEVSEDRRREYAAQLADMVRKLKKPGSGGPGARTGQGFHLSYVTPDRN